MLGKNGSGKSTLLRLLYGLRFPTGGNVEVLGYEPGRRQPSFLKHVFMVPEEFHLPNIRIAELLRYHAAFYPNFDAKQFEEYLGIFEVPVGQHLQQMSYGQKKKVIISLGLASNVPLLLMDEPTNGLDIMSKSQFRRIVSGVLTQDRCIIISTHQVKDLENLIDRVMIIDEGKILFDETIARIGEELLFTMSMDARLPADALYAEPSLTGTAMVAPNSTGEDSKTDLELLYKAVMAQPERIQNIFQSKITV